ncbi:uncharacterized protein LOC118196818 isoform X2 [Stegodyphus dumicola]|uniref:uncharacterized protein LOC118196818 isoform X2 n=1 Tax=Stegodyphus dumicola TaxID=202533 RepID=UPI0015ACFEE5|nr:uncharacterized protein LOC118196818 isoform X2 [Stegodyphus dumicola]
MNRDTGATSQNSQLPTSNASSMPTAAIEIQHGNESIATIVEDSNNNTSLLDREQTSDIPTNTESNSSQNSPAIREIHKNSWLKRMPCADRWSGRFPKAQKPEKFWVVFCVHDDKEAFLEFYENRRSAYSHMPLSNISLSKCLHISPTIVAQENDHEFVVTLETQVVRLAASTNDQMLEWMDTMRTKLRELGILEPKDNLYSKEPITSVRSVSSASENTSFDFQAREDFSRLSLRDPNSPLPPVPGSTSVSSESSNSAVVYIRNPPNLRASTQYCSPSTVVSPSSGSEQHPSILHIETASSSLQSVPESVFNFDVLQGLEQNPRTISRSNSLASEESSSPIPSPLHTSTEQRVSSVPNTPLSDQTSLYEPLFYSPSSNISISIRNPNYENPPPPQRRGTSTPTPALPPRPSNDQRRMSTSVASDIQNVHSTTRTSNLNTLTSTSDPSLHASSQIGSSINPVQSSQITSSPTGLLRIQAHLEHVRNIPENSRHLPSEEGPPPYNGALPQLRNMQHNGSLNNTAIPVDENGKPLSLREVQVQKLQSEIFHKSGVRLVLRKKDCVNAIALVECFNSVWVAGWKQKEHPLLHNTFHVGDRIISIAGHRILSVQDAHKAIKHQPSIVEFIVRRVPRGRVLAIRREYEGQDLGIIREGGTAEIKEVKPGGLVFHHGLSAKASTFDGNSLCNWVLTEINHRPLNLFFKDNEKSAI